MKWDSFSYVFLKNLEIGELDCEDHFPPEISIMHFTILFLSDFVFSFITNFVNYEKSTTDVTRFEHFQDFIDLSISVLSFSCHDILNLFLVSDRKKKIQEIDCEKTEYEIKDAFNHYGICLLFHYILKGNYTLKSLKTRDKINSSPLACVLNQESISNLISSMIYMIIYSENNSNFTSLRKFRVILKDLIMLLVDKYSTNTYGQGNTLIENIILEYLHLECSEEDLDHIFKLATLLTKNKQRLFRVLIDSTKSKKSLIKTLCNLNTLISKHQDLFKIDYMDMSNLLSKLTLSGSILDENVNREISRFYNTFKFEGSKEEYCERVNQLIGQIKNSDNETNLSDEEKALFKNNQNQLVSLLTLYIN